MAASIPRLLILLLFLLSFSLTFSNGRHFLLIVDSDDPDNKSQEDSDQSTSTDPSSDDFDEFGEPDVKPDSLLDPGSWKLILDPSTPFASNLSSSDSHDYDAVYFSAIRKLISASTTGDRNSSTESVAEISSLSDSGHPHAQSAMGFFFNYGVRVERSAAKAFTYHHFAAGGGNLQSKMALAYSYYRQEMFEKAVELYGELARAAVASFLVSKDSPAVEQVRINDGIEENKDALRKLRGEDDDDFQITEYQAYKGNALAMYKLGVIYYFGLRGVQPDQTKALAWLLKAVEKGEPNSMELLGEMYVRGAGVEKNYTKALEWLRLAAKQRLVSAYNGIGYLYLKGYGVEAKNLTKAREFFERAARHEDPSGNYNLGVMYLKGIGVKKDVKLASHHFVEAANFGQPKAFYQLAKMFQKGVGVKKDMNMAASFYKMVAERGPWGSLSRWALESYLKGDIGKAYLLYSRLAEMGYEFAQSSAAWILDKYGDRSLCIGVSGFCTSTERHQRAHTLWWQASEQGNEHAALLIGDAYYYGRGTERDYDRAAEAYMHAHSKFNAQAMFNLGYMHEHGQGLPFDLHLAKRYYDQALEKEPAAKLAVTLALFSIWIRKNYSNTILVELLDALPGICYKIGASIERTVKDEGNATIFTLFVALITVLYFRDRQRRQAPVVQAPQPEMAPI